MKTHNIIIENGMGNPIDKDDTQIMGYYDIEKDPYMEHFIDMRHPCPELSDSKGEVLEAELRWRAKIFGDEKWELMPVGHEPINAMGVINEQIYLLVPKEENADRADIIKSALVHEIPAISERTGISENWLAVWMEVEMFYGDVQKKETREQLLLRLQKTYSLKVYLKSMI